MPVLSILTAILFFKNSMEVYQAFNHACFYLASLPALFFLLMSIFKFQKLRFEKLDWFAFLLFIFITAKDFINGINSFRADVWLVHANMLILFFALRLYIRLFGRINVFARSIVILSTVLNLVAIYQYVNIIFFLGSPLDITATMSNANLFLAFECAVIPFSAWTVIGVSKRGNKVDLVFACIHITSTLFFSMLIQSRIAIFLFFAGLLAVFVFTIKKGDIFTRFSVMLSRLLLVMALILSIVFGISAKSDSTLGRFLIWKVSWGIIKEAPVMGWGSGQFRANYNTYQANYFSAGGNAKERYVANETFNAFCEPLELLTEHGIFGFATLTIFFFMVFRPYLRKGLFTAHTNHIPFVISAWLMLIDGLVSYPFSELPHIILFTVNLAIISAASDTTALKEESDKFFFPTIVSLKGLAFISLGLLIYLNTSISIRLIHWYRLANSNKSLQEQLPEYRQLSKNLTRSGIFLLYYGKCLYANGQYHEGSVVYSLAKQRISCLGAELGLAKCYEKIGMAELAEEHYIKACHMVPVKFRTRYLLYTFYSQNGQEDKATAVANELLNMPIKIPSVEIDLILENVRKHQRRVSGI